MGDAAEGVLDPDHGELRGQAQGTGRYSVSNGQLSSGLSRAPIPDAVRTEL